jgi:RNA polymerase sigma-70 factor (ECF subfamily)
MPLSTFNDVPSLSRSRSGSGWDWGEARRQCVREARGVLHSSAEVDDAVQEALLRVWRSRRTPRELERPLAWLRHIARNEALRLRARERRRRDGLVADDVLQELAGTGPADTALPERLELTELLATLPPADRRLVWLRYFEDLTQATVARRLGIPEGTVKVRLHRVRERLRRLMGEAAG